MITNKDTFEYEMNFRNMHSQYKKLFKKMIYQTITSSNEWSLSESQAMTLLFITHNSPCNMGDIHKHSPLTKGALTQIIDIFKEKNLIERIHSTKDRRLVQISITDEGLTLGNKVRRELLKQLDIQLDKLNDTEKIVLKDSLTKINQLLEKMGNIND